MRTSFLLSLTTLTVVFGGLSAQAETIEFTNPEAVTDAQTVSVPVTTSPSNSASTAVPIVSPTSVEQTNDMPIPEIAETSDIRTLESTTSEANTATDAQMVNFPATVSQSNGASTTAQLTNPIPVDSTITPIPGTALTSASTLKNQPTETVAPAVDQADRAIPVTTAQNETAPDTTPTTIAQDVEVTPGRATRSGASYIGIAGNIGLGEGDTALGEGSFAAISKIGLTRSLSLRPSVFINDDPTILLPLTLDFVPRQVEDVEEFRLSVAPYVGVGAAISIGDDSAVDFLGTAGVDVPLTPQFTATAALNVSAFDNIAVGLLIGVGYNFVGF
ncbi:MAG: hypothetical protein AB1589_33475 [Cyanobacteriota bacterium]